MKDTADDKRFQKILITYVLHERLLWAGSTPATPRHARFADFELMVVEALFLIGRDTNRDCTSNQRCF
jgi:hypothetical protein